MAQKKGKDRYAVKANDNGLSIVLTYNELQLLQQQVQWAYRYIYREGVKHLKTMDIVSQNHMEILFVNLMYKLNVKLKTELAKERAKSRVLIPTAELCVLKELHEKGYLANDVCEKEVRRIVWALDDYVSTVNLTYKA